MKSNRDKTPAKSTPHDHKKRPTTKSINNTSLSVEDQLRQQTPSSLSKRRRNDDPQPNLSQKSASSTTNSDLAPMDIEFEFDAEPISVYQQDKLASDKDDNSEVIENADNIIKELYDSRVDIRIKVPIPKKKQSKSYNPF